MCGLIGYRPIDPEPEAFEAFGRLFDESRVRGTHAYGIAETHGEEVRVFRSFDWKEIPTHFHLECSTVAHCRYCQSGDWKELDANNQPIIVSQMALAHNGVLHMGLKSEFEAAFNVICTTENDSEIFLRRLEQGQTPEAFIQEITGSFAAAWLQRGKLYALRNARRPLWSVVAYGAKWFCSTADIIRRAKFPVETLVELVPGVVV